MCQHVVSASQQVDDTFGHLHLDVTLKVLKNKPDFIGQYFTCNDMEAETHHIVLWMSKKVDTNSTRF